MNIYIKIILVTLIIISIGCSENVSEKEIVTQPKKEKELSKKKSTARKKPEKKIDSIVNNDPLLDSVIGTWYLTTYTDSTIKYKKMYDFNNGTPASAYKIVIKKENSYKLHTKGYWQEYEEYIGKKDSMTYKNEYTYFKVEKDSNEYILKFDGENIYHRKEVEIHDEYSYFAKHIFAGVYFDIDRKKEVILFEDFSVFGIDSSMNYSISLGRWEYYDTMDILDLENKGQYHWEFVGDTLKLTKAYSFEDNGGPAGYNIGKLEYRLVKSSVL